jgi:hypothetical protein
LNCKKTYNDLPIGPKSNGFDYFSKQTTISDDGTSHILYYTNRGWDGGKTFCKIHNSEIIFGSDWCYSIEKELIQICEDMITHRTYDFYTHVSPIIRNKSISNILTQK